MHNLTDSSSFPLSIKNVYEHKPFRLERDGLVKKLYTNEEAFNIFFTKSMVPIATLNSSFRFCIVNQAFCDMTGYSADELKNQTFQTILHPDDNQGDYDNVKKLLKGTQSIYRTEKRFITKDRQIVWGDAKINILRDKNGKFQHFVAMVNVITTRKNAEIALQEKTAELESFFNCAMDLFIIADKKGAYIKLNHSWETTLGYQHSDLENKKFFDLVHSEDLPAALEAFEVLKKNDTSTNFTCRYLAKNGLYHTIEWHARSLGKMVYAAARDLTDRKNFEESIKIKDEQLKDTESETRAGNYHFKITENVWSCSPVLDEIFGIQSSYPRTFESWSELVHEDDRESMIEYFTQSVVGHKLPFNRVYRVRRHFDRQTCWVHGKGRLRFDADGKPVEMYGTIQDITEQFENQRERYLLFTAIEQVHESVVITDRSGIIEYVNPAFTQISGYNQEEAVGKNPRILKSGRHNEKFYREMWHKLLNEGHWEGVFLNKRKNGEIYHEEASISAVRNHEGKVFKYVAVKKDITEYLHIEKQLRQSQKMEAIGTLSGGIAHDFNNILSAIIGYIELCKMDTEHNTKIMNYLEQAGKASSRAKDLVNQILGFSRTELQEKNPVQLIPIIKETAKFLRASIPASVTIDLNIETGDDTILGSAIQIQQVILNLATNAAYAVKNNGGTITITIKDFKSDDLFSELPADNYLLIELSDNGCGISEENLSKIFDPYFTTKPRGEGTGLGLSVVSGIIRQHKGQISVNSEPGKGTSFYVYLPKIKAIQNEENVVNSQTLLKGTEHILLVDDEIMITDILTRILSRLGYRVDSFNDPEIALVKFRANPDTYDLLLTDMMMPGINGMELTAMIKKLNPGLPVLLCSGFATASDNEQALAGGIEKVLHKPVDSTEMLKFIRQTLDKYKSDARISQNDLTTLSSPI